MVTKKSVSLVVLGLIAGLTISIVFTQSNDDVSVRDVDEDGSDTVTSTLDIHTIEAPIHYFDRDHVSSGSYSSTHPFGYTSARFDDGYRSHPKLIENPEPHVGHWEDNGKSLPPIRSTSEILPGEHVMQRTILSNIEKHGDWAKRFLPINHVERVEEFDVTGNGIPEYIIALCGLGGNRCPHETIMVDRDLNVIGSFYSRVIMPHSSGNGFVMRWEREHRDPNGYMLTRYVYRDGSFWPLYEQEVLYYRVDDTSFEWHF